MKHLTRALVLAAILQAAPDARAADDAGASTFESAAALYRRAPIRAEDVRVPPVLEKPENLPSVPDAGPGDPELRFAIDSFEVSNNTLLPASRIDEVLAPFRGADKRIADVQAARDALQQAYDDEGLLSVAVAIPQQMIDRGVVHLEVIEARVGQVTVENEGVEWFSEEGVRRAMPTVHPGALLRRADLDADLARANANPDRSVRPTLRGGSEPGTVDVALQVDDRIPLHGSITLTNDHAPGAPAERAIADLRYSNLWGLEHEIGVAWQFSPFERFGDVRIIAGTYRAPMPWDADQSLFYYVVSSDTKNSVVTAPDLSVLGNGLNMGLRYRGELPGVDGLEGFSHALTLAVDRKDITNAVEASTDSITTPITYLPFGFEYSALASGDHAFAAMQLGLTLNRAGTLPGGSRQDFEANRPGSTGNFEIGSFGFQQGLRLPSLLRTLAAGRFVDLPEPTTSFLDDGSVHVITRAQLASEPLISTEQFAAGGMDSVRGYLQSEEFGDDGWNLTFEVRSPALRRFLGGRLGESAQLVAFYDAAGLHIQDAGEGQRSWASLEGYGIGLRASFLDRVTAELSLARPRITTPYTSAGTPRLYFQVSAGF